MYSDGENKKIADYIRLAQEWRVSGMTRTEFARTKGLSRDVVAYRIQRVQEVAPEMLAVSAVNKPEFAPVPNELVSASERECNEDSVLSRPVLTVRTSGGLLQVSNQVEPQILKAALEVMVTC
ncbi:hypothetical protein BHK98_01915 [Hornefia porci]|uniref:Uncharacterized protein n=1 Tax=Hornefia porci TaxID=2652292 RepID=A0A1Q9JFR5_9FIRM|nr:hypothetical protein [Hornefia porci]OLR54941.1 hypothetical protein BHK98_01915 [Hornefia porci]